MKTLFGNKKVTTLHELFLEQLRDLYSTENQLIEALPEMAEAATDPSLKEGFENHLEQTMEHARRLEKIFDSLGEDPEGKTCQAMAGLIKEGKEIIEESSSSEVKDAGLITAAQRVEHYEMASYGTVRTYAQLMGHIEAAHLLQMTLDEEGATNKKLIHAAESINPRVPLGDEVGYATRN